MKNEKLLIKEYEFKKIKKKYENKEIWFIEYFNFKLKYGFYSNYDINELTKYIIKWKKFDKNDALMFFLEKEIPNNEYFKDFKKMYIIENINKYKNLNNKKINEYWQLFYFWGRDAKNRLLTIQETSEYWNPIEKESNGEWDFFNKKDDVEIEISNLKVAGGGTLCRSVNYFV